MVTLPAIIFVVIIIGVGAAGFLFGRTAERLDWNKLIDDGLIPKPRGKR